MSWIVGKSVLHRLEGFGMNEAGFAVERRPKICNGQEEEKKKKKEISSSKTRCDPVAPGKNYCSDCGNSNISGINGSISRRTVIS